MFEAEEVLEAFIRSHLQRLGNCREREKGVASRLGYERTSGRFRQHRRLAALKLKEIRLHSPQRSRPPVPGFQNICLSTLLLTGC